MGKKSKSRKKRDANHKPRFKKVQYRPRIDTNRHVMHQSSVATVSIPSESKFRITGSTNKDGALSSGPAYAYVINDVKRTGILATALLALLFIMYFIIR